MLRHDSVSRAHASIFWHDGAWYVEDRNSKNGTWLDGQCLASDRRRLELGHVLRFGARSAEEWDVVALTPPRVESVGCGTQPFEKQIARARLLIMANHALKISVGSGVRTLAWRAPYVTLQALGTERLHDRSAGCSAEEEGWLDRRLLAQRLSDRNINQDIFRIRRDFQKLELFEDADDIIEDRREQGKARLGMSTFRIE